MKIRTHDERYEYRVDPDTDKIYAIDDKVYLHHDSEEMLVTDCRGNMEIIEWILRPERPYSFWESSSGEKSKIIVTNDSNSDPRFKPIEDLVSCYPILDPGDQFEDLREVIRNEPLTVPYPSDDEPIDVADMMSHTIHSLYGRCFPEWF